MKDRSKNVNVGGIANKLVNSLEMGSVILHIEVIWNAGGGHGG